MKEVPFGDEDEAAELIMGTIILYDDATATTTDAIIHTIIICDVMIISVEYILYICIL